VSEALDTRHRLVCGSGRLAPAPSRSSAAPLPLGFLGQLCMLRSPKFFCRKNRLARTR